MELAQKCDTLRLILMFYSQEPCEARRVMYIHKREAHFLILLASLGLIPALESAY